jgi:hypothetical protein
VLRGGSSNHRIDVTEGVLATQCGDLLSGFFQARRRAGSPDRTED